LRPRFNENQSLGVEVGLGIEPVLPPRQDIQTILCDSRSLPRGFAAGLPIDAARAHQRTALYSPDFNSIKMVFFKLETHLRRTAERARDGLGT